MWAKWSGTHQDRKCSWSKTVLGSALDANGNTLSDASGKQYTWDFENRLTQAVNPGVGTTTFRYDPFGRRIQKSSPLGTTNYLYNGEDLIEEMDANANVLARYTQGENLDEPLAELRSGGASFYEADALGSITSLSSSAGTVANTYTYDSFGNTTSFTGTLSNPFRYTAREADQETGLYYDRARYYGADNGRFLAEDDIRYSPNRNRYAYVLNNPVMYRDPSGHSEECTLAGITTIRLLNTVINSNFGPWSVSPFTLYNKWAGTWMLFCTWTRPYERTVMGNALKVLAFKCTGTYPCGVTRGWMKYEYEYEQWRIGHSTETEREVRGPFSSFAVTPGSQASECKLYGP